MVLVDYFHCRIATSIGDHCRFDHFGLDRGVLQIVRGKNGPEVQITLINDIKEIEVVAMQQLVHQNSVHIYFIVRFL